MFWDEVRVVGGYAHQAVRLCMYASGWGHARQATTRRPDHATVRVISSGALRVWGHVRNGPSRLAR